MFFADELLEAIETLPNDEFEDFFNNLESGMNKAYEYLKNDWNKTPTDRELMIAKDLENDINCGINDTFGLKEMQQVEGLFHKLDLKTHANMSLFLKQSKLRLASGKIEKEDLSAGLKEIRVQRREKEKQIPLQDKQSPSFGEEIASHLFNCLLAGILDVSEITPSLIKNLLKELGEVNRKVAIAIKNLSPEIVLRNLNDKGLVWGARKVASVAAGTVGVIVYHLKDRNESLAFKWSIPFNYAFYSNWWNLKVYKGRVRANQELYDKMYHKLPHEGDNKVYCGVLSDDLLYKGTMGNSGMLTIEVETLNYSTISTTPFVKEMKQNF
ncbi:15403_t:CDS:2 [Funneliformis caledonium]|uniref:15403_t:CDS:1 n=1 Tax=Funneliformis caledonium TaxID=1117310 RepID=A0A9N8ZG56_9GLOM|nr:15403_t:CDS:2 [Funneliformis caledonium]